MKMVSDFAYRALGVSDDYMGFVVNSSGDLFDIVRRGLVARIQGNDLPTLNLSLSYENVKILDSQRAREIGHGFKAKGQLSIDNLEPVKIKIRAKGDRQLHRENFTNMSFKVDVKGDDRVFRMEEFAIQKPIIRNYGWELLIVKMAKKIGLMAPEIIPVNLMVNGAKRGVYFIEENFNSEFLEKSGRKVGPIFSLNEKNGLSFPNVTYETQQSKGFTNAENTIISAAFRKLFEIKNAQGSPTFDPRHYFDVELWARFFALIDFFASYHGAVPKSVKLYFNPSSQLFEPILYDNHLGGRNYTNFSLIDFFTKDQFSYERCGFVCTHSDWFKVFFKNKSFVSLFFHESNKLLDAFQNNNFQAEIEEVERFNDFMYAQFAPSDRVIVAGILPYYMNTEHLERRKNLIRGKLQEVRFAISETKHQYSKELLENNFCLKENKSSPLCKQVHENIEVLINLNVVDKDLELQGSKVFLLIGNTKIKNSTIYSKNGAMLVQLGGDLEMDTVKFDGLQNIHVPQTNWSGAVNIIKSTADLKDISFENTFGEDSLNVVHSKINSRTSLRFENIAEDAFDLDFSEISFEKIECHNVGNDCFDTSGSKVQGSLVSGSNIDDKLTSFGEETAAEVISLECVKCGIGASVKDLSDVTIQKIQFTETPLYFSIFEKKVFFGNATLNLLQNFSTIQNEKILLGDNSILLTSDRRIVGDSSNQIVKKKQYGNQYGKASYK